MKPSILLLDDEPAILFLFSNFLSDAGYDVKQAHCLKDARETVRGHQLNVVILDLILPDGNGIDWISDLRKECPDIAIIVITGVGDIPVAVEAMRRGADNFLTKPVNMADLEIYLRKSLEFQRLRKRDSRNQRLQKKAYFYFGNSNNMKEVRKIALMAAEHTLPVLVQGETGTGKSLLAKWIHEHSFRSSGSFVEVSCSNLRGDLLASELFGHIKGAFTSAVLDKEGLIEVADGGTLFLDEIGDMDLSIQAQFLKVIEEKQYRRLGEVKVRWSDFRLVCATNKNLQEETKCGRFRHDLYYRINIFPIFIASLHERSDDLTDLIQQIISDVGSYNNQISNEVVNFLKGYPWPGNIRELKNVLERAIVLAQGGPITIEHFRGIETDISFPNAQKADVSDLEVLEEQHIKNIIKRSGGNKRKAATVLGISKSALYRKLKKFSTPL